MKQNLQLRMSQNLALTPQLQQSIRLLQLSSLELNQELDTILQENPLLELVEGEDAGEDFEAGFDENAQQKSGDNDPVDADGKQATDADDAFNSVDYQETSTSNSQESIEAQPESTAAAEDFSATDFDESYDEYGSASNWDEGGRQNNNDDDDGDYTRQEIIAISLREHLLGQLKLMPLSERDQTLVMLLIDSINDDGYLEQSLEEMAELLPPELEIELLELETALKLIQHLDPPGMGAINLQECLLLYSTL